mmetsp:Transcript_22830/g.57964  ORF Transcript_22830/g.57964 Transcript_22830/m.57964 type:complete len:226 (-) Transcript_22830:1639-2316(-)
MSRNPTSRSASLPRSSTITAGVTKTPHLTACAIDWSMSTDTSFKLLCAHTLSSKRRVCSHSSRGERGVSRSRTTVLSAKPCSAEGRSVATVAGTRSALWDVVASGEELSAADSAERADEMPKEDEVVMGDRPGCDGICDEIDEGADSLFPKGSEAEAEAETEEAEGEAKAEEREGANGGKGARATATAAAAATADSVDIDSTRRKSLNDSDVRDVVRHAEGGSVA